MRSPNPHPTRCRRLDPFPVSVREPPTMIEIYRACKTRVRVATERGVVLRPHFSSASPFSSIFLRLGGRGGFGVWLRGWCLIEIDRFTTCDTIFFFESVNKISRLSFFQSSIIWFVPVRSGVRRGKENLRCRRM